MVIFRRSWKEQEEDLSTKETLEENSIENIQEYGTKESKNVEKEASSITIPLFVKVDKYKEIITTIQEIKTFLAGLRNLFLLLEEIEQTRNDTLNTLRITLQRIEKNIIQLDANFLKTGSEEIEKIKESIKPKTVEVNELEDSLRKLHEELSSMKSEIEKMKSI
ncbi:MAG: hypothetical protein QXZ20_00105 [Candidatus Aenigmatarchaeota archaeon]